MIDLDTAHTHCGKNKEELARSKQAGCFYCLKIFDPKEIKEYRKKTALCPHCNIDSVIGDASGIPIHEEFLKHMYGRWFNEHTKG